MVGPRHLARRYAVLALYQWQLGGLSAAEISRHFFDDPQWADAVARGLGGHGDDAPLPARREFDRELFEELLRGVTERYSELDEKLKPFLDRSPASIDPVELAILRLATLELIAHPELPTAVVLDEAIELTKTFGAEKGHKFINGVLDRLARDGKALGHIKAEARPENC